MGTDVLHRTTRGIISPASFFFITPYYPLGLHKTCFSCGTVRYLSCLYAPRCLELFSHAKRGMKHHQAVSSSCSPAPHHFYFLPSPVQFRSFSVLLSAAILRVLFGVLKSMAAAVSFRSALCALAGTLH